MVWRLLAMVLFLSVTCSDTSAQALPFNVKPITEFDEPWAMTFMPDGTMLVTEKKGRMFVVNSDGEKSAVSGLPDVDYGGQGGLGDVVLHPKFSRNNLVYISFVESTRGRTRGAAVGRGQLDLTTQRPTLTNFEILWRQYPKVTGRGHYGHRLFFDNNGFLWITSGDRQKFTPAQDMQSNLGKVLRLNDDGSVPADNPFVNHAASNPLVDKAGVYGQIWSLGHRNPLGIAQDSQGQLWVIEMGPRHGDELNLVGKALNYGYPEVSNGDHYDGRSMPDHDTRPEFEAPKITWIPAISPGHLAFVTGNQFKAWKGDALVAGLGSKAIVRIRVDATQAREIERYPMDARIRSALEGPQGAIWVLEDERGASKGRLLQLTPR